MLKGSIVALVTPFNKDNSINFLKLKELLLFHIENNTDGILLFGTTGEGSTLTLKEKIRIAKYASNIIKGRVPVILNIGSNCTSETLRNTRIFSKFKPDYFLVITPYYNKGNEEGIYRHYKSISEISRIPIIVYNVPSRTNYDISLKLIKRLRRLPNIVGIKEASNDENKIKELSKIVDDNFSFFIGNDNKLLEFMKFNASGLIGVVNNTHPKQIKEIIDLCFNKQFDKAYEKYILVEDYIHALSFEVNPIPIKEAMNMLSFNVGGFRLPLYFLEKEKRLMLLKVIEEMNL